MKPLASLQPLYSTAALLHIYMRFLAVLSCWALNVNNHAIMRGPQLIALHLDEKSKAISSSLRCLKGTTVSPKQLRLTGLCLSLIGFLLWSAYRLSFGPLLERANGHQK